MEAGIGPVPDPVAVPAVVAPVVVPPVVSPVVSPVVPGAEPVIAGDPAPEALPEPVRPGLDDAALDRLFRTARTTWTWRDEPVTDDTLRTLYDLVKLGPTSANCSPARFMFLRTTEAKERLRAALSIGNVEKAMAAPVVCIVAHDPRFYEDLPRLYPEADARTWFAGNEDLATVTAFRNGTLQGGYLIMAARALGLDCGPMSGFDNAKVDSEFLMATGWRSNFLVAIGYGAIGDGAIGDGALGDGAEAAHPARAPRLDFGEACRLY